MIKDTTKHFFRYSSIVIIISTLGLFLTISLIIMVTHCNTWWEIIACSMGLIILTLAIMATPIFYTIGTDELYLRLLAFPLHFPMSQYNVNECDLTDLKKAIRVFGSAGFMGYLGYFWSKEEGNFFLLLTNEEKIGYMIKNKKTGRTIYMSK